ncbi:helix-turn-helix domain-containing protein [Leifsonia shinshuensis]|uniref:Helix-turn-helix domain-containing protein n=1 Tax=Leifsonia shinshuensis TaxID=150026 RepID=A0A7G6YBK0_9MICO|nr:helix-turn-helix transcriptional regulator [Leifsonia shinshuensis]QNE35865.1 helix-turn-helix domain-containing protein [Leifsonia shinshuensis]
MSETIRQARKALRLTIRELADRLEVSAAAVSQMEKSEADETIKLATLRRAHGALGSRLSVSGSAPSLQVLERREDGSPENCTGRSR